MITIAERLQVCVRSNDLVARLGGDEFVVIMSDIKDEMSPVILANKLREFVKEAITIGEIGYFLSMSIGIANYPTDGIKTDDLLKKADVAMYQAKNDGKDCYRFFRELIRMYKELRLVSSHNLQLSVNLSPVQLHNRDFVSLDTHKCRKNQVLIC